MTVEASMPSKDVIAVYDLLERKGIQIWIDGGWAVDALLGEQTRRHADLDIALETRFLEELRRMLAEHVVPSPSRNGGRCASLPDGYSSAVAPEA
jgi:tRNA nucleotidyltransferase/poly(A) polymerase